LAFALPHPDVARVFLFTGKTWVFLSGLAIVFILARDTRKARVVRRGDLGSKARELLRYGIPRIPGDFALIAFFAAPAMLTAHRASIEQAGFVAFATSVLSSIGQIFGPISTVQLPAVTRMVTRGEGKPLRRDLFWLVTGGLAVTAVGIAVLEIIAGWLVRWYLGPAFQESAALLRIIAPAALPYVLYILLRSPIDALAVRAHNTRNLMAGLLVFLAIASFASSAREIVAGLTVGFAVTAVLTIRDARTLLRAAAAPLVATPPAV
jgi:O-antigen/teichoic acid export membrane protein